MRAGPRAASARVRYLDASITQTGFGSELAREVAADVLERFLRYVRIDTQSRLGSDTYPSTAKQLDLSRLLVEELRELGLDDSRLDEHGYVFATIPATIEKPAPVVGLIAHVDTSPDASGANVQPQVVRYEGGELPLPGDSSQVLRPSELPELDDHVGHDLVTSDGTTLLGADDKAGVAEIMAATAYLLRHPELPHGTVKIAFTPDEEVGEGAKYFDIEAFGADLAYTLDGSTAGEIQDETFSAAEVTVTILGHSAHPGSARGTMVSAIKLAGDLLSRLPREELSPEATNERGGFVHPMRIEGEVARTVVTFIARDFDQAKLEEHVGLIRRLADEVKAAEPRASIHVDVRQQYRNMKEYLRDHGDVVEVAEQAIRRAGLEPRRAAIRGGTDGAMLTERGLPTPNLFTGGHAYHSHREWVCVRDMADAVATIVHLVQLWAER